MLLLLPRQHAVLLLLMDGVWFGIVSIAICRMILHIRAYVHQPDVSLRTLAKAGPLGNVDVEEYPDFAIPSVIMTSVQLSSTIEWSN